MGRHHWSVHAAVVEQEIFFSSKDGFNAYLFSLDVNKEPYKVVSERTDEFGGYVAVIRKRYGEYPFLGETDTSTADPEIVARWQQEKARRKKELEDPYRQRLAEAGIYLREDI